MGQRAKESGNELQEWNHQFETQAAAYLERGQVAQALACLSKRQFNQNVGSFQMNDPAGAAVLDFVATRKDRQAAFKALVDWTFEGTHALQYIVDSSEVTPLPEWVQAAHGVHEVPSLIDRPSLLPVASSFDVLARLAIETGAIDDLLARLATAQQQGRERADVAWAMTLAIAQRTVPDQVRDALSKRLQTVNWNSPQESDIHGALLLAQTAIRLSEVPSCLPWSQQAFATLSGLRSDDWGPIKHLARNFELERGWVSSDSLASKEINETILSGPLGGNFELKFEAMVNEKSGFKLLACGLELTLENHDNRYLEITGNQQPELIILLVARRQCGLGAASRGTRSVSVPLLHQRRAVLHRATNCRPDMVIVVAREYARVQGQECATGRNACSGRDS